MRESIENGKILQKNKEKININKNINIKEAIKNEKPELKKIPITNNSNNKVSENELLSKIKNRKPLKNIPPKKETNNKPNDNFLMEIKKKLKKVNNNTSQSNDTKQSNLKNIDPNIESED